MSNLIRDSKCTCENTLDAHILRFRELRQKHPNHMPGWLESYEIGKSMEVTYTAIPFSHSETLSSPCLNGAQHDPISISLCCRYNPNSQHSYVQHIIRFHDQAYVPPF